MAPHGPYTTVLILWHQMEAVDILDIRMHAHTHTKNIEFPKYLKCIILDFICDSVVCIIIV